MKCLTKKVTKSVGVLFDLSYRPYKYKVHNRLRKSPILTNIQSNVRYSPPPEGCQIKDLTGW